jgi:hypothetical protein
MLTVELENISSTRHSNHGFPDSCICYALLLLAFLLLSVDGANSNFG